ncbi:MAG: DNA polymerase III subunit alpha [Alphaproteobacteria bacterium]|nr:MAG: DNA polymerase III subunit alpha [Alphaproteobacteria bacterium]
MSEKPRFIHLRVHSAYSLAEGANRIPELVKQCIHDDMPAVAVTDTNNLFGALEFSIAAAGKGVQPIIGCQLAVKCAASETPVPVVLLVQNETGYRNLLKLSSKAFLETDEAEPSHILPETLVEYNEGLICLTGGAGGPVGQFLQKRQIAEAEEFLLMLKSAFQDRLYIELMRHGTADETTTEEGFLDLAYKYDIPLVASNDCYFPARRMHLSHDALLCIAQGAYVSQESRRRVTEEHYFKSQAEMVELFSDLPEAVENTVRIAQRCSFLLKPIDPILPRFTDGEGESEEETLRRETAEGLDWRLEKYVFTDDMSAEEKEKKRKVYYDRRDFELDILCKMGFAGYFLIVADFIQWAKDHDIPVGPGRGSGAGSVVAWAMKITDLDPIDMNLLFERFLNPERISMPDFDIDFCQERRDEVIHYVQERYGRDRVAQIITFGKLQARAVVRDVGRVLQMPYGQVDKIAKLIPSNPANPVTLQEALDSEPDLRAARDSDENVARLIEIALDLEGLYRHASTHAAGVVIGDRPLDELVPLYRDPRSDMPVTQFNMKYVEQAGLVKFDFLGLKTISVVKRAIDIIEEETGEKLDPLEFPLDDDKTFAMLSKGDTSAVFQLESQGFRDLCRQMRMSKFMQIAAAVALYRPGPMENIPRYLACLHGQEEQDFMHPSLEPILAETYGVMIYQEQVMQVAQTLSGYSLGAADLLRKAMGKKIKEEMDRQREIFVEGAVQNDVDGENAGMIFDQVAKFAGYGFNRAHSAAYAFIAYQTAYLKANYPVEFMAATLCFDRGNTDKLGEFRQVLRDMRITLLPPDINNSEVNFCVETVPETGEKVIRYALAALKGVGEQAMQQLVEERRANGAFKDIYDLMRRAGYRNMNRRQMEALAAAGAFDSLVPNRAQAHAAAEMLLRYAASVAEEKESGQESLFGSAEESTLALPPLPDVEQWDPLEALQREFGAVGFYLSAHPLDTMGQQLKRLGVVSSGEVLQKIEETPTTRFKMAGIVLKKRERVSAKGNRFAFMQVSDGGGVYEVMMFSDVLAASRDILEAGQAILMSVDVDKQSEDEVRFLAQKAELLAPQVEEATQTVRIVIDRQGAAEEIHAILDNAEAAEDGNKSVEILAKLYDCHQEALILLPEKWAISQQTRHRLRQVNGVADIVEM